MAHTFTAPAEYYTGAPQLGVPSQLTSSTVLQLKGSRSSLRSVAAATGTSVGPSSTCLFQIPQELNAFLVPGSMYVRGKCVVTQVGVANGGWCFAGNNGVALAANAITGVGGASSLVSRFTVTLPGGTAMAYSAQDHFENGVIRPFCLSKEYVETDLLESESAGVFRINAAGSTALSKTAYFTIPVDVPIFNAENAVPLLLMSGGISLEIITNTVAQAFVAATNDVTNFDLSELSLVYEVITVSPEFKQALVAATASAPFTMSLSDRVYLGAYGATSSARVNVGLGVSSLKSLVGVVQAAGLGVQNAKVYPNGGLSNFQWYVNGEQRSIPNQTNDAVVWSEFQRAIGSIYDASKTSALRRVDNVAEGAIRTNYCSAQFAFGTSLSTLDDGTLALRGCAADQISLQYDYTLDPANDLWQDAGGVANAVCHLFALYDSLLSVQADGTCILRK